MFHRVHLPLTIKIAILILLLLIPVTTGASTKVEPSKLIFTLKPGERITDAIKVTNTQDTEGEFTANVYDWTLDELDRLVTFPAGSRPDTLDGLIKFNPRRFTLKPGESQYVRFTLSAPKQGDWVEKKGIIFFEQELSQASPGIGSAVITQVGATVYLSFTETVRAFHFYGAQVETPAAGPPNVLLDLANEGQGHIRYQVFYRLMRADGTLVEENLLGEQIILPEVRRQVSFPFSGELAPGDYHLFLELSFWGTTQKYNTSISFKIE